MLRVSRSKPLIFTPKKTKPILPVSKPARQSYSSDFLLKNQSTWRIVKSNAKKVLDDDNIEAITKTVIQYYTLRDLATKKLIVKSQPLEKSQVSEIPSLFIRKCNSCCGFCDFSVDENDYALKVLKTTLITELIDAIQSAKIAKVLTIECIQTYFKTFAINIFRPIVQIPILTDIDNAYDLEWIHLRVFYDSFTKFMYNETIRPNFILNQLDDQFIHNLFQCIRFPDKREQKCACELLLAMAERFPTLGRAFLIEIERYLSTAIYDEYTRNSLKTFLDFFAEWTTIYKGREWLSFFSHHVLPLTILQNFSAFEKSFTGLVCLFIRKNKLLVDVYLDHIFKHWPVTSPAKGKLYLTSLQTVVENFSRNISTYIFTRLALHISLLYNDCTSALSQHSFKFSQSATFLQLLMNVWNEIGPEVYKNAKTSHSSHWNHETRELASQFIVSLENIDNEISKKEILNNQLKRESMWKQIQGIAEINTNDKFLFVNQFI